MNQTIFFVKPTHIEVADEIFRYLCSNIGSQSGSTLFPNRELVKMGEEGWLNFYSGIAEKYPEALVEMARSLAQGQVDLSVLEGDNVLTLVKELVGPTRYEDNPSWTIRGRWGPYDLPHTIVHATSPGDFEREQGILNEYIIKDEN